MSTFECESTRHLLDAFKANELDGVTSMRVQEHLDACPACRREWQWLGEVDSSLERLREAAPPAPAALRERVAATQRRLRTTAVARRAATAAIVLVALTAGTIAWRHDSLKDPMPFVVSHLAAVVRAEPLAMATSDPAAAARWLNTNLPYAMHLPASSPAGYRLAGVRTCIVNNRPIGCVVYENPARESISLFVGAPGDCLAKGTSTLRVNDRTVHCGECEGTPLAAWESADNSYLLVGRLPRGPLVAFAGH